MPKHTHSTIVKKMKIDRTLNPRFGNRTGTIYQEIGQRSLTVSSGENIETVIDSRDRSNVFFFYMIIGFAENDLVVKHPDDSTLDKIWD